MLCRASHLLTHHTPKAVGAVTQGAELYFSVLLIHLAGGRGRATNHVIFKQSQYHHKSLPISNQYLNHIAPVTVMICCSTPVLQSASLHFATPLLYSGR